jgi:hypothetical protein
LAAIEAAWKRQEEAFKEVEVEWKEELFLPKGSQSELWAEVLSPTKIKFMNPDGATIPSSDLFLNSKGKMSLKDRIFFMERKGHIWSTSIKKMELFPIQYFFDDQGSRLLRPSSQAMNTILGSSTPTAVVGHKTVCEGAQELACRPLASALRPIDPAYRQIVLEDLEITGKTKQWNGLKCIEAEIKEDNSRSTFITYWLCEEQNYLPIQWMHVHQGKERLRFEIKYGMSKSGCWYPIDWRYTNTLHNQKVMESLYCTVERWTEAVGESPIKTLPAGTYVHDKTKPPDQQEYLIRSDGTRRFLNRTEQFLPRDQFYEETERKYLVIRIVVITISSLILITCLLIGRVWYKHRSGKK